MNKFLQYLIESPIVYYIYNRGSVIYGLNTEESDTDYLVVVDESFEVSEKFKEYKYKNNRLSQLPYNIMYENCDFIFYTTEQWFNKVTSGHLMAWECACLPKKFIIKEHVKLLLTTQPLQLRKQIEAECDPLFLLAQQYYKEEKYKELKKLFWMLVKDIMFVNQIIENHKIINFKEANSFYEQLQACNNTEEDIYALWLHKYTQQLKILNKATDGMLEKEKQKKIIQNA